MAYAAPSKNSAESAQFAAEILNKAKTLQSLYEQTQSRLTAKEQALFKEYFLRHNIATTQRLPKASVKGNVVRLKGLDAGIEFEEEALQFNGQTLNLVFRNLEEFLEIEAKDEKVGALHWLFSQALPQAEAVPLVIPLAILLGVPAAALVGVLVIDRKLERELKVVSCGPDDRFFYLNPKSYRFSDTPIEHGIKMITPAKIAQILNVQHHPKCTPETAANLEAYVKCDPDPELRKAAKKYSSYGLECTPEHKIRYDKLLQARGKPAATPQPADGLR
jgi:hypothetical protein